MKEHRKHLSFSIVGMFVPYLIILPLLCIFWGSTVFADREDSAAISFQTNIPYDKAEKPYIVRRGDTLHTIIRDNLGPQSRRSQAEIMESVRRLNPNITNMSRIYPGQTINLPGKPSQTAGERDAFGGKVVFYTVQKGDSLEKILMRQLNVSPGNMTRALRNVKEINPSLTDINRIAVSQIIRLPFSQGMVQPRETEDSPAAAPPDERDLQQPLFVSQMLTRNLVLAGQVINTFGGSLIMEGQYSIPISDHSQITIDCASIPMIEFDNGNAVFIALKTRLPDQVRSVIISDWPNYRFISVNEQDTLVSILNKIINQSGIYRMEKGGQFVIGEKPNIHITPDWTIHQVDRDSGEDMESFGEHGLLIYRDAAQSLPGYVLRKLSSQGLALTEIVLDRGVLAEKTGDQPPSSGAMPNIAGSSRIDMIYN
ncbi:MAG: LysM peptidoglycan-binding domain-containing protein, partial [Syntrophobacterales bacterium]|nr:LysM peptidoglycan-binding domain-containing protein [Syntrophobacterales bacterium]